MSSKSALKKKSSAVIVEDGPKRKSEGNEENVDNGVAQVADKKKKKKAESTCDGLIDLTTEKKEKSIDKVVRSMSVAAGIDLQGKYDRLKSRFEELKSLRTTEAEALLEQQKEHATAKEKVTTALITALKQEKVQLASLVDKTSEARLLDLEARLAFYESLTGMTLRDADAKKSLYSCTYTVHGDKIVSLEFDLTMKDDGQVEYAPKSTLPALPEYLREDIVFGVPEMPIFLSKMQNHMYKSAA